MSDNRNVLIVSFLCFAILFSFNMFFDKPVHTEPKQKVKFATINEVIESKNSSVISKNNSELYVSCGEEISFDLLNLKDGPNKETSILKPDKVKDYFFMKYDTKSSSATNASWVLIKNDDDSLIFEKKEKKYLSKCKVYFDQDYIVKVEFDIKNISNDVLKIKVTSKILKNFSEASDDKYFGMNTHEGFIGVSDGNLIEKTFEDLSKENVFLNGEKIWAGLTTKYYIAAVKFLDDISIITNNLENFVQFETSEITLKPEESHKSTSYLFCGPKKIEILDKYKHLYDFEKFDLSIDFGWFYFITRPLLYFLKIIFDVVGNMGVAIIVLTLLLKLLMMPLSKKSNLSMKKLRDIQPKINRIRELYEGDTNRINKGIADIYQKEKINPVSGCLPMVIQAPIFISLYKVLSISFDVKGAKFFGWIKDLSAPDPTSIFNLFGLINFSVPSFLKVGVWPVLMGLSMFLQQKISPSVGIQDPNQKKLMMMLPFVFTYMLSSLPVGVVIYWCFSNVFTILQQFIFDRNSKKKSSLSK